MGTGEGDNSFRVCSRIRISARIRKRLKFGRTSKRLPFPSGNFYFYYLAANHCTQ